MLAVHSKSNETCRTGQQFATIDAINRNATAGRCSSVVERTDLTEDNQQPNTLGLATDLAIAWLGNPNTKASVDEVPAFLEKVYGALGNLGSAAPNKSPARPSTPRQCLLANRWRPKITSSR
jgi:hypothetical protein